MKHSSDLSRSLWAALLMAVVFLAAQGSLPTPYASNASALPASIADVPDLPTDFVIPPLSEPPLLQGIQRLANLHTHFPDRPSQKISTYTVQSGDSAWSIAQKYDLQPETILWGNEWISAEAGLLQVGTELNILPLDGALHTVRAGDTWERIELLHGIPKKEIVAHPGNDFDLIPPFDLSPGQMLIIPAGRSPLVWVEPGPQLVAGLGRKSPGYYDGPLVYIGTGYYVWPIAPPIRITQNYWGSHPAIDMGTYYRQPIFASDSGTVIFSGWSNSGYGNLVIIDHGNGYWTYYAHNEANLVSVGQGVLQGQQVAESGSTGRSTGNHIDFRIRVDGGSFLNPLNFLPEYE